MSEHDPVLCPNCARTLLPGAMACACGWRVAPPPIEPPTGLLQYFRSHPGLFARTVFVGYGLIWTLPIFVLIKHNIKFDWPFILFIGLFMALELGAYFREFRFFIMIVAIIHLILAIAILGIVLISLGPIIYNSPSEALFELLCGLLNGLIPALVIWAANREECRLNAEKRTETPAE